MKLRRAGGVALVAAAIALLGAGCSPDPAEIPVGSGSQATSLPPSSASTATVPTGADRDADLAACIARSGFLSRPVAEPATDPGDLIDEEIAEIAARAQRLLEDQARYDYVLAQCHAADGGSGEPSSTPTP